MKTFNELTESHDEPPQPVVLMGGQVSGLFDNQGPLGQRQSEAGQGSVACSHSVAETHQ